MIIVKQILKILGFVLGGFVVLYAILFIISLLLLKKQTLPAFYSFGSKKVILAHQGGEGEYPSNTKIAFEHAYEAGSDVLDTDMHMTSDGVLVLAHDDTLEGRTNGTGLIADKTLAELQQLDFAYNWSQDGGSTFPYRGQGIGVYTLEQLFADFPAVKFGIEIKPSKSEAASKFCDMIKQFHYEEKTLVSDVDQTSMNAFRKACPTVATSATKSETTKFYIFQKLGLSGLYHPPFSSLQVPEKQGSLTILSKSFIKNAHKWNLQVYPWTIDTPEQAQHFYEMGADGVNTSYPWRIIDWQNNSHYVPPTN